MLNDKFALDKIGDPLKNFGAMHPPWFIRITALLIPCLFLLLLLSNCAPSTFERVVITREVIVTREVPVTRIVQVVVTVKGKSVTEMAYEILPPLAGTPSNLLTNSRWQFERYVMDGVELTDNIHGEWIEFEEITWLGFDGCNQVGGDSKQMK